METPRLLTIVGSANPRKGRLKGLAIDLETTVDFGKVGEPIDIQAPK